MKKLMFAAVIAASAAAFADPITAVDFEGANDYQPNESGSHFFFDGESNSSVVTNTSPSTEKRTKNFAKAQNAKYLALDTEGGTLWRSINEIATTPDYGLGTAEPVAATGTYLDTLVQFTVTEDEAPTVGEGDKLAIWLQADGNGETNLMVRAGYYNAGGTFISGGTNFVLSGVTVEPGQWCRLTVKAIDDVIDQSYEYASYYKLPVFTIQIDGTYVTASEPTMASAYTTGLSSGAISQETATAFTNGKFFLSLVKGAHGTTTSLRGVGFQGTGAVDEIVWTEDDPFQAATVEFTLTYNTAGDANVTLGAVTYTIGDDPTAQTPTENKIPDGATVSIAAPTFAAGYQLGTFTVGGTAVASPTFPYTFTMSADTTVSITSAIMTFTLTVPTVEHATAAVTVGGQAASGNTFNYGTVVDVVWAADSGYQITANGTQQFTMTSDQSVVAPTVEAVVSYPSYVGDDAALKTQYDTWKTTYGADSESACEKQFLLNVASSTTVADDALQIDSITENATAGWDIVVSTTATGAALSDGSKTTYNGYLLVKAADTLAGLATATPVAYPVTAVTGGKVSITVTSGKFMKVELTTTAPAQN